MASSLMRNSRGTAPDQEPDWYTSEPSIGRVLVNELQRFKRRMKARPIPVLLLAILMTAAVLMMFARKPRLYTARVILRISEGAISEYEGPVLPRDDLENYIYNFSLNDALLLEQVIQKHQLFQSELKLFGPDGAVEELREFLNIDAFHNYFYFNKDYESTPRSLRVSIEYAHQDPELAYKLASILADLVIEQESQKRLTEVRFAAENARAALERATLEHDQKQEQYSQTLADLVVAERAGDHQKAAMLRVETDSMTRLLLIEGNRLSHLRNQVEQIEFNELVEGRRMGLVFEIAGQVRPVVQPPPGPILLTLLGLICFCIFVPVCAIGLGTLDSRIHELEDVRRLGMPVVGHIPGFIGDQAGSLAQRGVLAPHGLLARLGIGRRRRIRRTPRDRVA